MPRGMPSLSPQAVWTRTLGGLGGSGLDRRHIALSPVTITSRTATIEALGLAPMAVLPAYQRRGMGSQLVEAGLTACHHTPYSVVAVLGHPHYYPRFGLTPAKPLDIVWEHDAPDEAFMVQALRDGALTQTKGVVKYRPEFQAVSP
jgi:putative acetyltransferase